MEGIFGTNADLISDLNLILQIIILFVLLVSVMFAKRRDFRKHGSLMGLVVILNAISFFIVMGPSLIGNADLIQREFYSVGVLITLAHAVIGGLAEILGVWLVGEWLLRSSKTMACAGRKKLMRAAVSLWFIAIISGISLYVIYYI